MMAYKPPKGSRRTAQYIMATALCCIATTAPAVPERHSNQNFNSQNITPASDVYKISVTKLGPFKVNKTGDDDSTGELHSISARLFGFGVSSGFRETSTSLQKNGRLGNAAYLEINEGDYVRFGGRALSGSQTRDLWVYHRLGAFSDYINADKITLDTSYKELDCLGRNICGRGAYGIHRLKFAIPNYATRPPTNCQKRNTYKLTRVDDRLKIIGENGFMPITRLFANGDVILTPTQATICISSTVLSFENRDVVLRNVASEKCLVARRRDDQDVTPFLLGNCRRPHTTDPTPTGQKWLLSRVNGRENTWKIKNVEGDKCINLKRRDNREGGEPKMVGCSGHPDQQWISILQPSGTFQLKNVSHGKCLNVKGSEHRNHGKISVYTCANTKDQFWEEG